MSKVDIGDLEKIVKKDPEIESTIAFASSVRLLNISNLGDFTSFIVIGMEDTTNEIIVLKTELLKFANKVILQLSEAAD